MTTAAFMTELQKLGVELKVDGDKLLCNAPKGVLTPNVQAELASRKAELITFLQTQATHPANDRRSAELNDNDSSPPLSFAQERLWYLDQLQPDTTTYNLPSAIRIEGALDVDVLRRSLNEIVSRYDILRTCFAIEGETPVQVIEPDAAIDMPLVDLSHLPVETRDRELDEYLRAQASRPFELASAPLLRAACIRTDEVDHVLFLMAHHTVFDGSSLGLLLRELAELYEAMLAGRESPLADVPAQYSDYARWQRNQLDEGEYQRLADYWQGQLGGELPTLQIPLDHPRPAAHRYVGSSESIAIDSELVEQLTTIGRDGGATLFMVLFSAFNVLLKRYTDQEDFLIGSPINARNRIEYENAIGFFVNTLVLRTDVSGNPSFKELLNRVRESCLGAYSHQEMPFEELVRIFESSRDPSRTPLFQAMFAFQDASSRCLESAGLKWTTMRVESGVARTDISFFLNRAGGEINAVIEYCTDLFDRATIKSLLEHYVNLLRSIAQDCDSPIENLALVGEAELNKVLFEWNDTRAPYPGNSRLHELVEKQSAVTPEALAITYERDTVSYAELNTRANRLAHYLVETGIARGDLVGVCLDRSIDMVVSLLAVLKAGGAYVPLDPGFPGERLAYMMQDAEIAALLTDEEQYAKLPDIAANVVCLDANTDSLDGHPDDNLAIAGDPEDIAYVIYTSGSTGKPKGVQVPHRGAVNFLHSMQREPGIDESDRLLAVTTLSFDISVLELFLPLTVGASVVVASKDTAAEGSKLLDTIADADITVMQATPATWRLMIEAGWDASMPIKVLCGGEPMPADLAEELVARASSVWNLYGPTETTVWSTCQEISDADQPVLIGHPIANTEIYIFDSQLRPKPVGVPGEIFIGGDGVTYGYINKPELTTERFLSDTIKHTSGKLYRTGDLGRWRRDGTLEHLGRIDSQVKVRGYRIELGEIESVLAEHPDIDQVAVNVWDAAIDDQRLVAYVVMRQAQALDTVGMRKHLSDKLPGYMLPQHYVTVDALPLTPNGKIDRKNLPAPVGATGERTGQPPATDNEKVIAGIWASLLGQEEVGRHDNFFDLGGHSLLAVKAVLEIEKLTGTRIELRHILLEDLSQIAGYIQSAEQAHPASISNERAGLLRRVFGRSGPGAWFRSIFGRARIERVNEPGH